MYDRLPRGSAWQKSLFRIQAVWVRTKSLTPGATYSCGVKIWPFLSSPCIIPSAVIGSQCIFWPKQLPALESYCKAGCASLSKSVCLSGPRFKAGEPASVMAVPYLFLLQKDTSGKPLCGHHAPTCIRLPQLQKSLLEQFWVFHRVHLSIVSLALCFFLFSSSSFPLPTHTSIHTHLLP